MRIKTCLPTAILSFFLFHQAAFAQFKDVVWIKGGNVTGFHSVLFSPDGKYVISAEKVTRFWGIDTGNLSRAVDLGVVVMQFSTDGKYIAGNPGDNTIRILDASTWDLVATFPLPDNASQLVLSPDFKFVITNTGYPDSTIALWEIASGNLVRIINAHANTVGLAPFSPDARYFLARSNNSLMLWETATGNLARTFAGLGNVFFSAFSPDGKYLAVLSEGRIKLLEVATGNLIRTLLMLQALWGLLLFHQMENIFSL
jgi:WD40 repeat protein